MSCISGIACLLFAYGERTLPGVVVLVAGRGLFQIGYVVPIWYVLRRRGSRRTAKGLAIAATITLLVSACFLALIYWHG
jgi:hypothetical protein